VIVANTNLLAYLLLPGAYTDLADKVWEKDGQWAAPVLWRSEFLNVLAGYIRKGLLTRSAALDAFRRAEAVVGGREFPTDAEKVLELVESSTCSAYDCEFVALAEELGVALVTSDTRVLANFPKHAITPADFTA
jgi:predicted nucleic acid-binding protein